MVNLEKKLKDSMAIKEIRDKFQAALPKNRDKFDEQDVQRILTDDWYVKRFLIARNRSPGEAFKMIMESLEWRKTQGFATLPANAFPQEFYFVNAMFDYEPDLEGNVTLHIRVRYVLRCGPLVAHAVKWASKFFYDLENRCQSSFFTILIDFSGCGIKNAEFDFVKHAVVVLKNYTPACVKRILIIDLPPILRLGYNFIKSWIPDNGRSILKFISRSQLTEYIDPSNLPDYLGGTCSRPYQGMKVVPEGCPTAVEYGLSCGIPLDQCVKIAKTYEPLVKEIGLYDLSSEADFAAKVESELKSRKEGKLNEADALKIAQAVIT
ncbi:motile sperm domain-containing protein 2 [Tetranychus urticae]|uniref:CRAL-TRIO domain-containing protein n=1 Tax=Tetranychus urticae TaxID=32264 RepID=T1KY08_TETUR|nr:motile sperm domain-containing protein 2 [Tetranychus urticae]XP_015791654.1 motile sperm domain-containing protein 2 [Tetranychus urticae]XP_025017869.1 motile sperm domain-containing protein 2 [Tetranychus urticae]